MLADPRPELVHQSDSSAITGGAVVLADPQSALVHQSDIYAITGGAVVLETL